MFLQSKCTLIRRKGVWMRGGKEIGSAGFAETETSPVSWGCQGRELWAGLRIRDTLSLQKGEVINVAVKTCKKDCTLDNKEKFMSEAGRCPWGKTSTGAGRKPGDYADQEEERGRSICIGGRGDNGQS